jgi:hypothetical protein
MTPGIGYSAGGYKVYEVQTLTLSADASAVDLDASLIGGFLYSIEIYASADDAMTFSIASHLGTTLYTTTTTGATSGQIETPTAFWPISDIPTYTLSGLGSGTVTVEITVAKR